MAVGKTHTVPTQQKTNLGKAQPTTDLHTKKKGLKWPTPIAKLHPMGGVTRLTGPQRKVHNRATRAADEKPETISPDHPSVKGPIQEK